MERAASSRTLSSAAPADAHATAPEEGAIPIRYRLPNPPPLFLGRHAEIERLATAIGRGPVAVVHGLGGLGKTSLILQTFHQRWPSDRARTLFLGIRPSEPKADLRVAVVRACAGVLGVASLDWASLLADGDALTTTAIDLADQGGFRIVLDDMHHADAAGVRQLLGMAARHARRARWIGATRIDPEVDGLRAQTIVLGGLEGAHLVELVRACAPDAHPRQIARIVERASGSPWRAHALLYDRDEAGDELELLAQLPKEAVAFVEALAAFRAPLPLACLTKLVRCPDPATRIALQRGGVLEATGGGLRLHDVARALVRRSIPPARLVELEASAAFALSDETDPVSLVERLRLLLGLGRCDEADALLGEHFAALVMDGYAGDLHLLLGAWPDTTLERWRIRCVVELGDPASLAATIEPAPRSAEDELTWIRLLFLRGHLTVARERARELLEGACHARCRPLDPTIAFRVTILLARSLLASGQGEEALTLLLRLAPRDADEEAARRSALVEAYLAVRRFADVGPEVLALMAMPARLSIAARREVGRHLIVLFVQYGWLRKAAEILDRWVINPEGLAVPLLPSQFDAFHELLVQLGRCDFEKSKRALVALRSYSSQTSVWQAKARTMELVRRFAVGELAGIDDAFDEALAGAEQLGLSFDYGLCLAVRDAVALVRGIEGPVLAFPKTLAPVRGTGLNLARVRRAIRSGQATLTAEQQVYWEQTDQVLIGRAKLLSRMARIEAGIAAGALEAVVPLAEETIAMASDDGWGLTELDVRQLQCEAFLVLGRDDALRDAAAKLLALAQRCGSPRFEAHARFHAQVAREGCVPFAALEVVARALDVAPDLARRARALLGQAAALDTLDVKIVEAHARRAGARCRPLGRANDGEASAAAFGIDAGASVVWFPDGRVVDLSEKPTLFAILTAIADAGGAESKAGLARRVWSIEAYHPLRDDKRIQVAVRKLRTEIEADPSNPRRLVTTEMGYRFGDPGAVRCVEARADAGSLRPPPHT